MNWEPPDVQARSRKGRDQIANIHWIREKTREFQKTSTSASLTTLKPLTVWITTNCGKFLKKWQYQTALPVSWETCIQVKKRQLELDMQPGTGSKLGKDYIKAVYCHLAYLPYMQSESESEVTRSCLIPWTVAHQASLSMGFSRQEYWSGLLVPSPGDHPDRGMKPGSPAPPKFAGRFFTIEKSVIKLLTFTGSWRKRGSSKKHLLLLHWLHKSLWLCRS